MKIKTLILLLFISISVCGQQTKKWLENIENPQYSTDELKKDNVKSEYLKHDFSTLLTPKQDFLGFIGQDYRRIRIYFTSITKDSSNKEKYINLIRSLFVL